jgi:hypothetical protein
MPISIQTSRQPWTRRPGGLPSINIGHPLLRGVGDWFDWGAGNTHNLVYPQPGVAIGSPAPIMRADGFYTASGQGFDYARHGTVYGAGVDFSLLVDLTWEYSDGTYSCVVAGVSGRQFGLYINASGEIRYVDIAGVNTDALNRPAFTAGQRRQLVITRQGTTTQAYVDGVASGASWTNNGSATTGYTHIGFRQVDNARITATYHRAAMWHRALAPAEIAALANPRTRWEMYTPVARRSYAFVGGGGGAYSLSADPGAYSLTGSDASPRASRRLSGDAGSYALTGSAAGTRASRRLSGDAGSYALTGSAAGTRAGRVLSADAAAYAVTGSAASTLMGRRLSADAGSYASSGTDATLRRTYVLTVDPGAYELAGAVASLVKVGALEVTADPGVYALTGANALLRVTRVLLADPGSYTSTGSNATTPRTWVLAADAGSYGLTGASATLNASNTIVPDIILVGTITQSVLATVGTITTAEGLAVGTITTLPGDA